MSPIATPPGMMKMGNRLVPISKPFGAAKTVSKKFLIVIQFYEGDRLATEELCLLIAALQRTRNHEADILLMRRQDSREISAPVVAKLQEKFDKVLTHVCRRTDAKSHPHGPNQMFGDLATLTTHSAPFATEYYAFVNLEGGDCTPTRPGWIGELIAEWRTAAQQGAQIIGYIHDTPTTHMNGVAVWPTGILRKIPQLIGAGPQVPYDIYHRNRILPLARATPLIRFKYRQPTITPAELFAADATGIACCLYHGVKDGSARAAVRARHVTFTEMVDVPRITIPPRPMMASSQGLSATPVDQTVPALEVGALMASEDAPSFAATPTVSISTYPETLTSANIAAPGPSSPIVYTYAHKHAGVNKAEFDAILEAWKQGWSSRGWNPVVLGLRDAAKHVRFDEFQAALEKLPCATTRPSVTHDFNRWLALEVVGGGLMVSSDVLPADFTPANSGLHQWGEKPVVLQNVGAFFTKEQVASFVNVITTYDAQPDDQLNGKPHVTDQVIAARAYGLTSGLALARFDATKPNERKSVAMMKFLREGS